MLGLRDHHRVALAFSHADPVFLVDGQAVVAAVLKRVGGGEDLAGVVGVGGVGGICVQQVDVEGHGRVGHGGLAVEGAHGHVGVCREDVGAAHLAAKGGVGRAVDGQVVVLVDDAAGRGAGVGLGDVELVGLEVRDGLVVVAHIEVAGVLAVLVGEAPFGREALAVGEVLGLGAKAVLDDPGAVAFGQVVDAVAKIGARVGVVVAHDGHAVVHRLGLVGVMGPLVVKVGGGTGELGGAGGRVVGVHRHGHGAAGVKLRFNGGNGLHVGAGADAVFEDAGLGQKVAVGELVEGGLPEVCAHGPIGEVLLGVDAVGGKPVGARVAYRGAGKAVDVAPLGELFLGGVLGGELGSRAFEGLADPVAADDPGDDVFLVLVGGLGLGHGADARSKERRGVGQGTAGVDARVGVLAGGVVALPSLGLAGHALGHAAVGVDQGSKLQLGEVEGRGHGALGLGGRKDARLAGGDGRERPAGVPRGLVLDRGHQALLAQVDRVGGLDACQGGRVKAVGGVGLEVLVVELLGGELGPLVNDGLVIGVGSSRGEGRSRCGNSHGEAGKERAAGKAKARACVIHGKGPLLRVEQS